MSLTISTRTVWCSTTTTRGTSGGRTRSALGSYRMSATWVGGRLPFKELLRFYDLSNMSPSLFVVNINFYAY